MIKIGYLGPKGTFSQEAVKKYINELIIEGSINYANNYREVKEVKGNKSDSNSIMDNSVKEIKISEDTSGINTANNNGLNINAANINAPNINAANNNAFCINPAIDNALSINKANDNEAGISKTNNTRNFDYTVNGNKYSNDKHNEDVYSDDNDNNENIKNKRINVADTICTNISINAYSEQAYNNIGDMLAAIKQGYIHEAVVPIENSLEGPVNETLDLMASDMDLKIKGEVIIPIRQNLLVRKGTCINDIKYILSHPQPVGQCRDYIFKNFPEAEIKLVYSTAGAAEMVSKDEYGFTAAAIGSLTAADVYGLEILAKNIQDGENNFTRFVIIAGEDSGKTGDDKTSLVFSTENKPGSLYRILEIFNLWDINMTKIESRPAKKQLGQYIFFVDIEGHREDEDVKDALIMVKRKTSYFKLLGSYPVFKRKKM
ncbi:MAG TPA: prephenate dehydratase [Clostridiales bacterium]|nr:prephenate dehydratase [Clostridiales bacterium]